ncbi:SgcJ/EcaC family oxidoreductase [Paracoccus versutus]|uniref:Uncharacterized protein (TIGR02246 family) n=1 Tax=Paracoccus versutus TaxID=34007 RepID=A0A3D9XYS7_PARVE|nr:SgcJ/EcaC family oxidoreductase [Paracoccus versutus]REF73432.1 uncharacterized protein (TIGR02246 family) [Paracoccus versutus]
MPHDEAMMQDNILLGQVLAAFNAGAATWDADRMAQVYWDDAVFYGLLTNHSVGQRSVRDYFAYYKDILKGARLVLVEQEIRPLGADAFLAQGFGDFTYDMADGSVSRNRLRTSLVVARRDGEWKIVLHHFSPIPPTPTYGH